MHSYVCLATAAIFAVRLVAAQSLQDLQSLPQCAVSEQKEAPKPVNVKTNGPDKTSQQQPAETAFAATGCGLNEPTCVCKNADFQTSLTNEVMKDCSQTDQIGECCFLKLQSSSGPRRKLIDDFPTAVLKFSTNFCASAGITVNVPQTTDAAAQAALNPTPAPASSSAPPPPPPPPPPAASSSSAPPPPPPAASSSSAPPPPPPSSSSAAPASTSSSTSASTSTSSTMVSSTSTITTTSSSSSCSSSCTTSHSTSTSLSFFIAPAFSAVMTAPYTLKTTTSGQVPYSVSPRCTFHHGKDPPAPLIQPHIPTQSFIHKHAKPTPNNTHVPQLPPTP